MCGTHTPSVSDRRVSSADIHPHIYIPTYMHFVLIMQRRKCVCVSPVLQGVTGAGAGGGRERRGGMHVPLCNDLTCNPPTRIVKRRETISAVGGKFIAQTAGSSSVVGDIKTFTYGSGDEFHEAFHLSRRLRWKDPNRNRERQISLQVE